jgi:hypothetical protein
MKHRGPLRRQEPIVFSPLYAYVRGRQLERTFPGDWRTGVWPITEMRISRGWGSLPEEYWPYDASRWPPEEPPGLDQIAKTYRLNTYYRRVRDVDECKIILAHVPISASLKITDEWYQTTTGKISLYKPSASLFRSCLSVRCYRSNNTESSVVGREWLCHSATSISGPRVHNAPGPISGSRARQYCGRPTA